MSDMNERVFPDRWREQHEELERQLIEDAKQRLEREGVSQASSTAKRRWWRFWGRK